MRAILLFILPLLFFVGCGEEIQNKVEQAKAKDDPRKTAVAVELIQNRNGVAFLPNEDLPFTGFAKEVYTNQQVKKLIQYENGLQHGKQSVWYENGQKKGESQFKLGKPHGRQVSWYQNGQKQIEVEIIGDELSGTSTWWYENGLKKQETDVSGSTRSWYPNGLNQQEVSKQDGEPHGTTTYWYPSGQIRAVYNYEFGKLETAESWLPDGRSCPDTNLVNGSGTLVMYNDEGSVVERNDYKDGLISIIQSYEIKELLANLSGPIKGRFINIELRLEVTSEFVQVLEMNEHRLREKALSIMRGYTYEDAQLDGFKERLRTELGKAFDVVLRKYRDGESDLIRQIHFTHFVVQ